MNEHEWHAWTTELRALFERRLEQARETQRWATFEVEQWLKALATLEIETKPPDYRSQGSKIEWLKPNC